MKNKRLPLPKDKAEKEKLLHFLYYNITGESELEVLRSVSSMYKIAPSTFKGIKNKNRWQTRKFEKRKASLKLPKATTKAEIIDRICEGIAQGYTIASMCEENGTTSVTFCKWRKDDPKVEKKYIEAAREFEKQFQEKAVQKAKVALLKDLEERTYEEKKTFYKVSKGAEGENLSKPEKVIITQRKEPANSHTAKYIIDTYEQKEKDRERENQKQDNSTSLHAMSEEQLHDLAYDYLDADWFIEIPY